MRKTMQHWRSINILWDHQLTKAKTLSLTQCWISDTKLSIMLCKMLAFIVFSQYLCLDRFFVSHCSDLTSVMVLTCRQLGTKISSQILHRTSGLMLCFELLKTAFFGNTGEGKEKILRENLSPFLSFLSEQGRNWAIRFWEPLFPVPCATFWTWTWVKFHSWLLFPALLGTIWGQDNGIHHSFVSTAAPWMCCDPLPYKGL